MDLADLDLGLLLALQALLREGNVSHAAVRLGIGQSALSARIARLRAAYGDPLFVPAGGGRGVVPTPFAASLQPALDEALRHLRCLAQPADVFDPTRTRRTFTVATLENPAMVLAPALIARVVAAAPAARIAVVGAAADAAFQLQSGEADLLLAGDRDYPELLCRKLLDSDYATAQRLSHPRGTAPLDLDAFCALDHVLISSDGGGFKGVVDQALAMVGRTRRVAVSVQSYALAPLIVAGSDCICTMPRRILERFAGELDVFPPPLTLPGVALFAFWHPRNQADQGHAWLREQIYAAARVPLSG